MANCCGPAGDLCGTDAFGVCVDPNCDPSYCVSIAVGAQPGLPADPGTCHGVCDATYGSTDSAAWSACIAQCGTIDNNPCNVSNPAGCIPNWIPLPNSPATTKPPFSIPAVGAILVAVLVVALLAGGFGQGLAQKV